MTMDVLQKASFEAQSKLLRAELKTFETTWAKEHGGKKPGRDDIKNSGDMAEKYKQYNKIRDILSGKVPPPSKHDAQPKKRASTDFKSTTPSKRQKHTETPSKARMPPNYQDLETTPLISRKIFSPQAPTSIGPTPQRDGRVLGLFDIHPGHSIFTPSRGTGKFAEPKPINLGATPSKRRADDASRDNKLVRTPSSLSKRQRQGDLVTPLKDTDGNAQNAKTPTSTSVSKLSFDTPAFLKRHSFGPGDENTDFAAPAPLRLPRKPLGRGLSAIVASLRQVEEEEHDDDLDAMREIEAGGNSTAPPTTAAAPKPMAPPKKTNEADILIPDSQPGAGLLGGFDDEGQLDSSDEEQLDRNGNPLRVFKKKGQKRTTRRSNMKPVYTKRPTMPPDATVPDEDDIVPETQLGGHNPDDYLPDDLDDFVPSDEEEAAKKPAKKAKKAKAADEKKKKEGTVKKTVRKVNELAHANFRRLKLKNTGSKGGPGINSRFRRRR
ncbi:DNA replication regulator SLD2 [Plectosphaerella plurivora]|uniref:DNA replication regulator SLD2 n=1 Tax=Plectosphaerella plurivora TaxID=936078 RepID=A0A9P8VD25_9PEZI|nr:DNA replication regulator SLD2 [Plectosphaerella plurivora]